MTTNATDVSTSTTAVVVGTRPTSVLISSLLTCALPGISMRKPAPAGRYSTQDWAKARPPNATTRAATRLVRIASSFMGSRPQLPHAGPDQIDPQSDRHNA